MLPLQQAYETREAIIEYLKATFNFKEKEVTVLTCWILFPGITSISTNTSLSSG